MNVESAGTFLPSSGATSFSIHRFNLVSEEERHWTAGTGKGAASTGEDPAATDPALRRHRHLDLMVALQKEAVSDGPVLSLMADLEVQRRVTKSSSVTTCRAYPSSAIGPALAAGAS